MLDIGSPGPNRPRYLVLKKGAGKATILHRLLERGPNMMPQELAAHMEQLRIHREKLVELKKEKDLQLKQVERQLKLHVEIVPTNAITPTVDDRVEERED